LPAPQMSAIGLNSPITELGALCPTIASVTAK
jgi:hypothetical protein